MLLLHHPFFLKFFLVFLFCNDCDSASIRQSATEDLAALCIWLLRVNSTLNSARVASLPVLLAGSCSALPAQHLRSYSGGWAPFFTALTLPTRPKLQKDCSNGRRADHRQKSQMGQVFSQGQKISRRGGLWVCLSRQRQTNRPALRAQAHPLPRPASAAGVCA